MTSTLSLGSRSEAGDGFDMEAKEPQKEADLLSVGGEAEAKKKITKFEPFNLTKPKPKLIQEPEPMKREVKANEVPKGLFTKLTLADIEK